MKKYGLLFCLFYIPVHFSAQAKTAYSDSNRKETPKEFKESVNKLDKLMKSAYTEGIFNGNVLVSKNNKIIYKASLGFSDAGKTNPLTEEYRFHLGSITKEFSAAALLQLEEQGKLKLSDHVSKFIPELPGWADEVTIKDLLQYTSGIPNVNWKTIKNDKDIFNDLMLVNKLTFVPGTEYDYNNNNLFLRQFIIEHLTGMPYKTYIKKFVFQPLQMNASIMTPIADEKNIAQGFNSQLVPDKEELPITGGTYTTTVDLLKWADGLHFQKVVDKNSVYELGQSFNIADSQSALGNVKFEEGKLKEHFHDGRAGSFEATLFSDVENKITIILLSNNYSGKLPEISEAIYGILKDKNGSSLQQ
ncbi:serine hydrolase domain-containing protein [Chryseobacterium aurantiacum]|uniref:serine hydrolase domain-containing protein n=1 Tax=Chryseobacterium aurantiacum TaxID=2116499 RepID=UPI000D13D215|nr:serine hydrolase domain-containing protein [Chryseobacterium aurantiacum]